MKEKCKRRTKVECGNSRVSIIRILWFSLSSSSPLLPHEYLFIHTESKRNFVRTGMDPFRMFTAVWSWRRIFVQFSWLLMIISWKYSLSLLQTRTNFFLYSSCFLLPPFHLYMLCTTTSYRLFPPIWFLPMSSSSSSSSLLLSILGIFGVRQGFLERGSDWADERRRRGGRSEREGEKKDGWRRRKERKKEDVPDEKREGMTNLKIREWKRGSKKKEEEEEKSKRRKGMEWNEWSSEKRVLSTSVSLQPQLKILFSWSTSRLSVTVSDTHTVPLTPTVTFTHSFWVKWGDHNNKTTSREVWSNETFITGWLKSWLIFSNLDDDWNNLKLMKVFEDQPHSLFKPFVGFLPIVILASFISKTPQSKIPDEATV